MSNLEDLNVVKVQILVRIPGSKLKRGSDGFLIRLPNEQLALSETGTPNTKQIGMIVFSGATEGVHFNFID